MEFTIIAVIVSFALVFAFAASFLSFKYCRENRETLKIYVEQIAEMDKTLESCKRELDKVSQQNSDFARQIAWLESRQRQPKTAVKDIGTEDAVAPTGSLKPTITERRHRVLRLASTGQNAETIAATLGMLAGEVELILNLNRVTA